MSKKKRRKPAKNKPGAIAQAPPPKKIEEKTVNHVPKKGLKKIVFLIPLFLILAGAHSILPLSQNIESREAANSMFSL